MTVLYVFCTTHQSAGAAEGGSGGGGAGEAGGEWWSWRGWGAGALLLVAALLLVRATDRCFTRNYARCTLHTGTQANLQYIYENM